MVLGSGAHATDNRLNRQASKAGKLNVLLKFPKVRRNCFIYGIRDESFLWECHTYIHPEEKRKVGSNPLPLHRLLEGTSQCF